MDRKDFFKSYRRNLNEFYEKGYKEGQKQGILTGAAFVSIAIIVFIITSELIKWIL